LGVLFTAGGRSWEIIRLFKLSQAENDHGNFRF
jgi:hypothetical protein